jgi:hypothetical protein
MDDGQMCCVMDGTEEYLARTVDVETFSISYPYFLIALSSENDR